MAVINKTSDISVLALQSVAASTVLISSVQDVSTKLAASFFIWFGRRAATAAGAGVNIRLEASAKASGDDTWMPIYTFTTNYIACEAEAVNGTVNSGTNVVTVASTTNLTVGDYIFINNTTIGNSEWHRIKSISANVSVTLEENLMNAQTGSTIYDAAEYFHAQLDLTSLKRIRVVVDGAAFTQAHAIEVLMVTGDSIA